MSLQYRLIAQDRGRDTQAAAFRAMDTWLKEKKSIKTDLAVPGRRAEAAGKEVNVTTAIADDLAVARYSLYEEGTDGRWATILTAITSNSESWLWVDVEWVSEDPWGRTPIVSPPTLAQYLLIDETAHIEDVVLPPGHLDTTTARQAAWLAAEVMRFDRHVPLVVISPDQQLTKQQNLIRAKNLARSVLGISPVYLLGEKAQQAFNDALGREMQVYGGAVRTYMPTASLSGLPLLRRHRVMGAPILRQNLPRAIDTVASPLRIRALSARPPEVYRERGRELLQTTHGEGSDELLLADAIAAESAAAAAKAVATELREQLEWQSLEMEESLSELESAEARVRYLTAELAKMKVNASGTATPASFSPPEVHTFEDVLAVGKGRLKRVVVGDTQDAALQLDSYAQAPNWAKKAWRALAALEVYAVARSKGEVRDFPAWCEAGLDPTGIPGTWVMPVESDSVNNNPKYRDARMFPVPTTVSADGSVYMAAHIKIVQGGRPAPRIHYFDDTAGPSKKVWVGYVGPHLPNGQTN